MRRSLTSLYEIFTPSWFLELMTFRPSGVGGKYWPATAPTRPAALITDLRDGMGRGGWPKSQPWRRLEGIEIIGTRVDNRQVLYLESTVGWTSELRIINEEACFITDQPGDFGGCKTDDQCNNIGGDIAIKPVDWRSSSRLHLYQH